MYCPDCGKEVEEGSKFCNQCGGRVSKGEIQSREKETRSVRESLPSYDAPKIIPQDMLKEGEKLILETHPHKVYTLLPWWILAGILVITGVPFFFFSVLAGIVILLFGFLLVLISYLLWRYTIYAITTGRVIKLEGVIGKNLGLLPKYTVRGMRK